MARALAIAAVVMAFVTGEDVLDFFFGVFFSGCGAFVSSARAFASGAFLSLTCYSFW
nr:hypothetical protein [uncultured Mitsuokella sp.]